MANELLTKITNYGTNLLSNELKEKATRYILIGSTTPNDADLLAKLAENDVQNNLTYDILSQRKWIGYEGPLLQKYYDENNFLSFDFEIPSDYALNIYVYGFGIIDISGQNKQLISITRSPSIFNKVKNTTALFSIKMTFGQEDVNSQFRDNIHDSIFLNKDYLCMGSGTANSNEITGNINLSSLTIGTKIEGDGIPANTVITDTFGTDNSLDVMKIRISKPLTKTINKSPIFIVKTLFQQSDFVTRAEFNQWQKSHNHNSQYYMIDETVKDSLRLDGKDSSYYATIFDTNKIKEELTNKLDKDGGSIYGSLLSKIDKATDFREEEFVPLFHIRSLLDDFKLNTIEPYTAVEVDKIKKLIGIKNVLLTTDKTDLVSAINEVYRNIGNPNLINYSTKEFIAALNFLLSVIGNNQISNGKSIIENVEELITNKADKSKENIFTVTPKVNDTNFDLDTADRKSLINLENINLLISKLRRIERIDLSNLERGKVYPIILNESGSRHYTDSIIWNTINTNLNNSVVRLEIRGCGSVAGQFAAYLNVAHSCRGTEQFIKRIYVPSQSSAVVVYLRGGSEYFIQLNGTDANPLIIKEPYTIQGTATIVGPEEWNNLDKVQAGNWIFNQHLEITIDGRLNPHFIYDPVSN